MAGRCFENFDGIVSGWLGVPFRYMGCDKLGCDCAGLVIGVFEEVGVDVFDLKKSYLTHKVPRVCYIDSEKILGCLGVRFSAFGADSVGNVCAGDILALKGGGGRGLHLAIVSRVKPLYVLHANRLVGHVVETIADDFFLANLLCWYSVC